MNEHEYPDIEYHNDRPMSGGTPHAAINVKRYTIPTLPEEDQQFAEAAYETARDDFWEQAKEAAHDRGYSCVFAEGRSGGWCVPFYQWGMSHADQTGRNLKTYGKTGAPLMMHWPGQGGGLGFPEYPDMDKIGERSRFRAFQAEIERLLLDVPYRIRTEAAFMREQALEEVV